MNNKEQKMSQTMLLEIGTFIAGCIVGGLFVYQGMTRAIRTELLKPP